MRILSLLFTVSLGMAASLTLAQSTGTAPYKILKTEKVGGAGGFDYVFADAAGRRLYIPRGDRVTVFDLDSLKSVGVIANTKSVHGAAVDPKSHRGFSSSNPVLMWDTETLATLKSIPVEGNPDGILFDPATQRVFVLSHRAPNVTVLDSKDGSIVGTISLGGAPEQAACDEHGRVFIDIEDKDKVAVVDAKTLKVTATYDLAGKGGTPAGLALDVKNHILFVCCRNPATAVVLNADDGKILATLPIGAGTDGAVFNAATMEAFSSNSDGTLTVIKETTPTTFEVTQNLTTMVRAKTCTLDAKTNHVLLIAAEMASAPAQPESPAPAAGGAPAARRARGRGQMVPDSFTILAVGR